MRRRARTRFPVTKDRKAVQEQSRSALRGTGRLASKIGHRHERRGEASCSERIRQRPDSNLRRVGPGHIGEVRDVAGAVRTDHGHRLQIRRIGDAVRRADARIRRERAIQRLGLVQDIDAAIQEHGGRIEGQAQRSSGNVDGLAVVPQGGVVRRVSLSPYRLRDVELIDVPVRRHWRQRVRGLGNGEMKFRVVVAVLDGDDDEPLRRGVVDGLGIDRFVIGHMRQTEELFGANGGIPLRVAAGAVAGKVADRGIDDLDDALRPDGTVGVRRIGAGRTVLTRYETAKHALPRRE